MRSPDFGIVAGLAVFVLLCASLPYMSIYTSNETHNSILIKYSFDIADYIKSEISAVSFNRFYAEKYHILNHEDQQVVRNIFEKMLTEYNINSPYSDSKLKALLTYLIIFIIEHELSHDINGSHGTVSYTHLTLPTT